MRTAKDLLALYEQDDEQDPAEAPKPQQEPEQPQELVPPPEQGPPEPEEPGQQGPDKPSLPAPDIKPNTLEMKIVKHFGISDVSDLEGMELFYMGGRATVETIKDDKIEMDTDKGKKTLSFKQFYELLKDKFIESVKTCRRCGNRI